MKERETYTQREKEIETKSLDVTPAHESLNGSEPT